MNIDIRTSAVFEVPFTIDQLTMLIKLSLLHYDTRCKEAGRGFLPRWRGIIECCNETTRATFHELDTCLKILEMAGAIRLTKTEAALCRDLRRDLNGACTLANDMYAKWQITYSGTDKAS